MATTNNRSVSVSVVSLLLGSTVLLLAHTNGFAEEEYTHHTFRRVTLSETFYSEGASFGDFNRDGHQDIVSGPYWYEGPTFEKKHEYYTPKAYNVKGYSDNFFAFTYDFDGDEWLDILIYGFPGKDASWFRNPQGKSGHWKRHVIFDVVDNESPYWIDITGDGRPEIVCAAGGRFGYASADWSAPQKKWIFTAISKPLGIHRFTHGLGLGDIDGDGRLDVLWKDGWFSQPAKLDGKTLWKHHPFRFTPGRGGAQMLTYDIDGDGDNDVVTSLNAHGFGLVWWENRRKDGQVTFVEHPIMGSMRTQNSPSPYGPLFSGLHAFDLVDMDGDGVKDFVTGTRWFAHGGADPGDHNAENYWFRLVRKSGGKVEFVPHRIDDGSGVGTQIVTGDVDKNGLPDVIVGNKKGTFVLHHETRKISEDEWRVVRPRRIVSEGLSPKEAAFAMTAPKGFRVQLAAGEPDVHQPVQFALDDRGRLWVVEGHTYPARLPEGKGQDRILIFEDTNGDGTLDSRKVFIDGLNLVSGIEIGFGGVWIGAAPYLMFIPDRDGDDKPDGKPEILLDGWGYQDTHETLNSFIWGPDGWLYGCQGVFTHSRVGKPGTPDAERTPLNACVWRYHPTRHEFEVFAWGTSNPWGLDFNEHGHAFITACVIPHLYHVIQNARYQRQAGSDFNPNIYEQIQTIADHLHHAGKLWTASHNSLADKLGGGHAHCGAMIYLGDAFPDEYRGRIYMNNIHGNRVNVDHLERSGSGYVGRHGLDFVAANDRWFRGINMKYGPDGSVWLIDWYDKQACHHGLREAWDRTNGRIYRISHTEQKALARRVDVGKLDTSSLVALQLHENDWYVRASRRALQERGPSAEAHSLLARILATNPDVGKKLRALWSLHVTKGLTTERTKTILQDAKADENLVAWTIQLAAEDRKVEREIHAELVRLARDSESPLVRLYLASALSRVESEQAWPIAEALATHAEDASDQNIPLVLWYGIEPLVSRAADRAVRLTKSCRIPKISRFITRRIASNVEDLEPLMKLLAGSEDSAGTLAILEQATTAFEGHAKLKMPSGWKAIYEKLAGSDDDHVRSHTTALAVKFGDRRVFPQLRAILANREQSLEKRQHALEVLVDGEDPDALDVFVRLLDESALRRQATRALALYDSPNAVDAILASYAKFTQNERVDAIATLSSRSSSAKRLLHAVAAQRVPRRDISAFTIRQLANFRDAELDQLIVSAWGKIRATATDKITEIASHKKYLTDAAIESGDLLEGRSVFERTCATCHAMFGSGETVAPDLTGSNRANLDYILENIVDPDAVVGKDYQLNVVVTKTGRVVSGLIRKKTTTALTVRTINEDVVIPLDSVAQVRLEETSMMPKGLLEKLTRSEIVNLIAYLRTPTQVALVGDPVRFDETTNAIPGAIEGEKMKILKKAPGHPRPQPMEGFPLARWSANGQLWWTNAKPFDVLELALPVAKAGRYQIDLAMTKAIDYGIVQFHLDGNRIESPIDLFNDGVTSTGPLSLGTVQLTAGEHRLSVEIVGANSKAVKGYMFGLDYVRLIARD